MLAAVANEGFVLKYASPKLRADRVAANDMLLTMAFRGSGASAGLGAVICLRASCERRASRMWSVRGLISEKRSCEQKLLFVGCKNLDDQEAAVQQSKASGCKPPMYGVLKCIHCKSPGGAEGKFPKRHWHRDINASVNIGKAYIYAARNQVEPNKPCPRPSYLARPIQE